MLIVRLLTTLLLVLGVTGLPTASAEPSGPAPTEDAVTSAVADDQRGEWTVSSVSGNRHRVRWTSDGRLPISAARPEIVAPNGTTVGRTRLVDAGRAVEAELEGPMPVAAELDVVLGTSRLDEPTPTQPAVNGGDQLSAVERSVLAEDPGVPGPHAVTTWSYALNPLRIPGFPKPVEMKARVVAPVSTDTTDRPLVMFLHGRHDWCYAIRDSADSWQWPCGAGTADVPNEQGYDYLQQLLASRGHVTVSIRANGINAQDHRLLDAGTSARADLLTAHLRHWKSMAGEHRIDLDRVVLVGHSRGGEGVNRLVTRGAPAGVEIVGQVLLAPTNFGDQRPIGVPTVAVLPYCDGDVSELSGQRYVDAARSLSPDDPALRSAVLVMGANHNYFNTEWTPGTATAPAADDWSGPAKAVCGRKHSQRLSAADQRAAARVLVGGAVHLFVDGAKAHLPLFDGSPATTPTLAPAVIWSTAVGGDRDTRRSDLDLAASAADGATVRTCRSVRAPRATEACWHGKRDITPNWPDAVRRLPERRDVEVAWQRPGTVVALELARPLDLDGRRLQLTLAQDPVGRGAALRVQVSDGAGRSALLPEEVALPTLPGNHLQPRRWARTIDFPAPAALSVDLSDVRSVALVATSGPGRIWVRDVASVGGEWLGGGPDLASLSVDNLQVTEGDGPGAGTALVPWRATAPVPPGAVVRMVVDRADGISHLDVPLEAGEREGHLSVPFPRNRRHEDRPVGQLVRIHSVRGVNTDGYVAAVKIIDDDPAPWVRLVGPRGAVAEGGRIRLVVRLARGVSQARRYTYRFVRVSREAQVADLGPRWRRRHLGIDRPRRKLSKASSFGELHLKPGRRRAVLKIPVAADNVREGEEQLRIKLRGPGLKAARTVRIKDR